MKQAVSPPVVMAVILAIVAVILFFFWMQWNSGPAAGPPKEHTLNMGSSAATATGDENSTSNLVEKK